VSGVANDAGSVNPAKNSDSNVTTRRKKKGFIRMDIQTVKGSHFIYMTSVFEP
jgi:hypothetical protein